MFKKLFKSLTTLTLLVGCYFGYVHVFAIVVEQLRAIRHTDTFAFPIHDSKSLQESIRYAEEAFGRGHWSTNKELAYRYYNAERGYWIYAKECQRIEEEDGVRYNGKRIRMKPFLLITKSRDGKDTKTITSDRAVFDLNAPLGFDVSSGREPLKIKHAHLEPNVMVCDDKGTPLDKNDDLIVGPLTTVDYEESTQQITTEADTYVVMRDLDMRATAYGMLMQLRKDDPAESEGASAGFAGVERLDLLKNVHVVIRDVGKSGIMPGPAPGKNAAPNKDQAELEVERGPDQKTAQPVEPTPLDLTCDSKMQVLLPRSKPPVLVGPPAPPAATLAQFDRNVVVLRGKPDDRPDQLTCDTLKLRLVPAEKPPASETQTAAPKPARAQSAESVAQNGPDAGGSTEPRAAGDTNQGLFGGLTLQHVHATGHAVWLMLPNSGIKLRCNEMIHMRQLPVKPDVTYFRGDRTRPVEIVKVDVEKVDEDEDERSDQAKITSVTNIWTVDATLFDSGLGMDTANIVAHGPGRLETRPDRDQPVERIAIWQDKLIVINKLGPENQVLHKVIDLFGSRPCFIDNLQKTSVDSASWIEVWLKPKPATPPVASTGHVGNTIRGQNNAGHVTLASTDQPARSVSDSGLDRSNPGDSKAGTGGGNLQMEQLHALVDVHLMAPAKTLTARDRLDAEFVDLEATQVASTTPAKSHDAFGAAPDAPTGPDAPTTADTAPPGPVKEQGQEQVAAQDNAEKPADDPPMTGVCDRIWARVALKPKKESDIASSKPTGRARSGRAKAPAGETDAEIRRVWMWGNVALHQDPKKNDKVKVQEQGASDKKGMDASGEALYLDNRGTNKAITYVYQRDLTERIYLPGPLPPARVENSEDDDPKKILAAGVIQMNQETDQAWVDGPGTLTQLAARGFLSDKAPESDEDAENNPSGGDADPKSASPGSQIKIHNTGMVRNDVPDETKASSDNAVDEKPKTRAGVPLTEKAPMTIGFSESMTFTGRSVDPYDQPAARADFHGIVTARMEDALLHCTEKMIAFTDREVPLAQLGKMTQNQSQSKSAGTPATGDGETKSQAELTLIYCYRNAIGISRKVDPDLPLPIQQQRIEADKILAYDRRTGDFTVPGKGKVFLYDRDNNSSQKTEASSDSDGTDDDAANRNPSLTETQRTVTQTSSSASNPRRRDASAKANGVRGRAASKRRPAKPEPETGDVLSMVLTQIHFKNGMRGQFGSGKENDKTDRRWSEFHGNVEAFRAKVRNTWETLNPDRLPADGLFLTGQTLRVIQEPPPARSPKSAPARQYLKAWDNAFASSNDKVIDADVITYDSYKDLVYAYGEEGHNVAYAEQHATGQPTTAGSAKAVQLNPKTGNIRMIDNNTVGMIDKNTGFRPSAAKQEDPYAKKKKPVKKPFKLPTMNVERRGWTGS